MLPVAILSGGLGTRLGSLTAETPKALLDIAGKPFLVRQLEYLASQEVTEIVLCVGHLGDQVEDLIGDGRALGVSVRYSRDGRAPLGTGGAIRRALPLLGGAFFVCYGDSFLPIRFGEVQDAFDDCGQPALMTVLRNEDHWDRSNACFKRGLVDYDKDHPRPDMRYIDYGLSILTAQVFNEVVLQGPFDLADLYRRLSRKGRLAGYEVRDRFYEIGSVQGLSETIEFFRAVGGQ